MVLKAHADEGISVWNTIQELDGSQFQSQYNYTDLSLGRLRNENIFFIVFQIFQTYLGIDSVIVFSYS
jgi:hypothetical protein